MKSVKILLSLLALGLVAAVPLARAQDETPKAPAAEGEKKAGKKGGGRMSPEQRVAAISDAVGGLTDDQKAKVLDVLTTAQKDAQAARESGDREKMGEIMRSSNEKIRALLTPEQQTKFDAMPRPGRGGKKKGE